MLKLTLEYDGAPFVGWQVQAQGRSVQGELQGAIERLCGAPSGTVRVTTRLIGGAPPKYLSNAVTIASCLGTPLSNWYGPVPTGFQS